MSGQLQFRYGINTPFLISFNSCEERPWQEKSSIFEAMKESIHIEYYMYCEEDLPNIFSTYILTIF